MDIEGNCSEIGATGHKDSSAPSALLISESFIEFAHLNWPTSLI